VSGGEGSLAAGLEPRTGAAPAPIRPTPPCADKAAAVKPGDLSSASAPASAAALLKSKAAAAALLQRKRSSLSGHSIHSVITSNGSPYQNWQTRIM
jgi:hypothetical protein